MDTTSDDDFLLTVYWWGKPVDTEVNYAYSHAVQEQGSCFRRYRAEHNDAAHSCDRMDVRKSPDQSKRLVVSNILGPSAGRRLPSSSLPLRLNATADGGPHGVLNAQVEEWDEAAVEWRRAKLFANFDAKAKAAWSLEFEADALAAQSECRFLQAEIHRLLAQRAAERLSTGRAAGVWCAMATRCAMATPPSKRAERGRAARRFSRALWPVAASVATPFVLPRFGLYRPARPQLHGDGGSALPAPRSARRAVASFSTEIRRLEFSDAALVGSGYDLVDVRVLTKEGAPVEATFMLDSGLSTNLVSPSFLEKLGLEAEAEPMEGTALGGNMMKLRSTYLPGLEILGDDGNETRFAGLWQGDGWRAWCTLDWEAWKAFWGPKRVSSLLQPQQTFRLREQITRQGAAAKSKTIQGKVQYEVLPSQAMSDAQLEMVGWRGQETVEGEMKAGRFLGRGVSEQLAQREGIQLDGMLGQLPLYQDFAVEVDPEAKRLTLRMPKEASAAAKEAGMRRLPGMDLPSRLMGVNVFHAALTEGAPGDAVPALVVNWAAAEVLFGLRQGDRIIRQAPRIRAIGVGGGFIDMPLLRFSLGLVGEGDMLVPHPVRVAIGDAQVFGEIFGREERGGWFGMGPKPLKPAALIGQEHGSTELGFVACHDCHACHGNRLGACPVFLPLPLGLGSSFLHQDILSQQRHIFCASEPALYAAPGTEVSGSFRHMGEGCTTDDAAWECLSLPPGSCGGIAVTPQGTYQGLCYIFVSEDLGRDEESPELQARGFFRYEAPQGQELAPPGERRSELISSDS
eukprot:g16259.t1